MNRFQSSTQAKSEGGNLNCIRISTVFLFLISQIFSACGAGSGDATETECTSLCVGDGSIQRATGRSIETELAGPSQQAGYLVVPFFLGSIDKDNGRSKNDKQQRLVGSIQRASSNGAVDAMVRLGSPDRAEIDSFEGYSHALRSFWNRFNPRIEDSTSPSIELQLSQLESAYRRFSNDDSGARFLQTIRSFETRFGLRDRQSAATSNKACPEEIFVPGGTEPLDSNLLSFKEQSQGDFCLVVVKDGSLVSEKDVTAISESIASALASYKLIYRSNFDFTRGDYAFRPLVIVVPMDDPDIWPQDPALQLAGAFVATSTEDHSRPTIYVPADMTKLGIKPEKANESFHAAIAHELQHAIVNYHRMWRPDSPRSEVASIDEGLAHFMEDLLGFGELNFRSFAGVFLASTAVAPEAILHDQTVEVLNESARGAAQSLIYYLMSQTGGVSFSGGAVDVEKSQGLVFIRKFLEGDAIGVGGLSAALSSDWQSLFANFVGALYVDNATKFEAKPKYSVLEPQTDVIDTIGKGGKKFGMRFNSFVDLPTVEQRLAQTQKWESADTEMSLYRYQAKPLLVPVDALEPKKIKLSSDIELENMAATIIRIN